MKLKPEKIQALQNTYPLYEQNDWEPYPMGPQVPIKHI